MDHDLTHRKSSEWIEKKNNNGNITQNGSISIQKEKHGDGTEVAPPDSIYLYWECENVVVVNESCEGLIELQSPLSGVKGQN